MKTKQFFSVLFVRLVSFFSINRNGQAIGSQKWDNLYDSVLDGRIQRQ